MNFDFSRELLSQSVFGEVGVVKPDKTIGIYKMCVWIHSHNVNVVIRYNFIQYERLCCSLDGMHD